MIHGTVSVAGIAPRAVQGETLDDFADATMDVLDELRESIFCLALRNAEESGSYLTVHVQIERPRFTIRRHMQARMCK